MNIRLYQENIDNGDLTCNNCIWSENSGISAGFQIEKGCMHPILFDENEDIIEEVEHLIIECIENPKHCILMCRK